MKRHSNAWHIQQGACNVSGITRALVLAVDETLADGKVLENDPAIRLIVHQLAFLCRTQEIDSNMALYADLMAECEGKKGETS